MEGAGVPISIPTGFTLWLLIFLQVGMGGEGVTGSAVTEDFGQGLWDMSVLREKEKHLSLLPRGEWL